MKYPDFLSANEAISLELEIKQVVGDDPEKIRGVMDIVAARIRRIMDLSYEIDGLEDQVYEASQVEDALNEALEKLEDNLDDAREELREEREYVIEATNRMLEDIGKISQKASSTNGSNLGENLPDVIRGLAVLEVTVMLVKQNAGRKLGPDDTHGETTWADDE